MVCRIALVSQVGLVGLGWWCWVVLDDVEYAAINLTALIGIMI